MNIARWIPVHYDPGPTGHIFPHYRVFACHGSGMEALRDMFPKGIANELNAVLFSTSGVHGSYFTIEEIETWDEETEESPRPSLTFLVIQPRTVTLRYGECEPESPEDFAFLKRLRQSSWAALLGIGWDARKPI